MPLACVLDVAWVMQLEAADRLDDALLRAGQPPNQRAHLLHAHGLGPNPDPDAPDVGDEDAESNVTDLRAWVEQANALMK